MASITFSCYEDVTELKLYQDRNIYSVILPHNVYERFPSNDEFWAGHELTLGDDDDGNISIRIGNHSFIVLGVSCSWSVILDLENREVIARMIDQLRVRMPVIV